MVTISEVVISEVVISEVDTISVRDKQCTDVCCLVVALQSVTTVIWRQVECESCHPSYM